MNESVYITGHKNPDTDSICSSIGYAELKKRLGVQAVPVRIGKINKETAFVLERFGVKEPEYLKTVKTQVSDLDLDVIPPVSEDISIKTAWNIMQKNNRQVLPVTDDAGKLLGIISLSDITNSYMASQGNNVLSKSHTPLRNVTETLNARLVCGNIDDVFRSAGKVVIATMAPDSLEPFVEKNDIVLVGNRKDSQMKVLKAGVSCLIATCGGHVDKDVLELAEQKGCIVMETNHDTFTAARLINQSIPVGYVMTKNNLICFNVHDFIDYIRDKMLQTRFRSYPIVDDDGTVKGFVYRYHLISPRKKKVILLDHNEMSQTVDGIDQAEILEIIDHHRIGDIQTGSPVYFRNDTVGSTATLIANMYVENGIRPTKEIAGILCAAILSDTLNLKSPTTTYLDRETVSQLAEIAGVDPNRFAAEMFQAGSSLADMNPDQILYNDFKDYNLSRYKIGIGQINAGDPQNVKDLKGSLLEHMKKVQQEKGYSLLLLMMTDIVKESSHLLYFGREEDLIRDAFGAEPRDNEVYLEGVVSRKKQVVPLLTNAIQNTPR
ncbi:Cobalt-dependent inorganic pyrophosphatase [Caprobacter fermentans]|uniref:inorganic diphosphatase n=1 Tax=Caproicibacter fermentans TaxID=2576756 RepID=A0A6N8I4R5_9FIRM|nr:putative manganese-dependent inorganic diphosphatase [Caproicibacter fermentans]MVB12757.1 Cobalt-dependent inorganic pyrophosphatase [Caproicibacter fermentans]OCN01451.1 inorganic pyrophosphatase [Clostridium sp. W14A]QNK40287.1 putative manganese-dependent inorganic diphosphatase [Caproicibacter fermentans]